MIRPLLGAIAAYLLGSIPWAYIAGRVVKGIDLRVHGSGNLGATNVYRMLGAPAAVGVLLADTAKGALAVLWLPAWFGVGPAEPWTLAYGLAAILGHVRSVFLLWRGGGKGVATAAGVFAALAPIPLGIAMLVFLGVLATTRVMSLGSLSGAVALPVAMALTRGLGDPFLYLAVGVAAFVFWTHRSNIERLRRGVEPRLGQKTTA